MKYDFIINPKAGQGKETEKWMKEVQDAAEEAGIEYRIEQTECPGDGETKARAFLSSLNGEEGRVYAFGGDGTLNEVINGAAGFPNAAVGAVPIGTGNDTIRNFFDGRDESAFLDIRRQIRAEAAPVDLLRYTGEVGVNGSLEPVSRYAINMFNNGFDCNVVVKTQELKKKPLISGSLAYLLAILIMFIRKEGITLRVTADGKPVIDGSILLCAAANGCYCGGGIKSAPLADMADGVFDLNIIQNTSHLNFLRLFPKFTKGEHLEIEAAKKIITYLKCREVTLAKPDGGIFTFCVDGEIAETKGLIIEIAPQALRFLLP